MNKAVSRYRLHAIKTIVARASQSRFWSAGIFITITISLAISAVLLVNFVNFTETNLLSTEKQPLATPVLLCVILLSLYLALEVSLNVSREHENSTIEMLFYGPVDEISYMVGQFLAQIKIFSIAMAVFLVWLNLSIWLLNLAFRLDIFLMLAASIIMCGELTAFGLLVAAWGGKRRNTLVYFLIIILLIGGIQVADLIVSTLVQVQKATANDPVVVVRNVLNSVNQVVSWVSPYSQLSQAFDALLNEAYGGYFVAIGIMAVEMLLMLAGSIILMKRKGVRG